MGSLNSTPFTLTGSASYAVAGGVLAAPFVPLSAAGLVNPLTVPIQIDDIEIVAVTTLGSATPPRRAEIDLRVGRWAITNGYCPIRGLGPRRETVPFEPAGMVSPTGATSNDTRWILPRPLVLGPQEALAGNVRHSPALAVTAGDYTVTITLTARGKRFDGPVPRTRVIPYASGTFFTGPTFVPPPFTFGNPFRVPLNVAAINFFNQNATTVVNQPLTIVGPGGLSAAVRRSIMAGADTRGAFGERLAIEEPTVLMPDEFFQITSSTAFSAAVPGAVVMTGYREEA